MRTYTEERDGRTFTVTVLPPDQRSTPSATRRRTMFATLTSAQKKEHIRSRVAKAKKRRRRHKRGGA